MDDYDFMFAVCMTFFVGVWISWVSLFVSNQTSIESIVAPVILNIMIVICYFYSMDKIGKESEIK